MQASWIGSTMGACWRDRTYFTWSLAYLFESSSVSLRAEAACLNMLGFVWSDGKPRREIVPYTKRVGPRPCEAMLSFTLFTAVRRVTVLRGEGLHS